MTLLGRLFGTKRRATWNVPEEDRRVLEQLLAESSEHASASEVLWSHEHPALALKQEQLAIETLLRALRTVRLEWLTPDGSPRAAGAVDSATPAPEGPALEGTESSASPSAPSEAERAHPAPAEEQTASPPSAREYQALERLTSNKGLRLAIQHAAAAAHHAETPALDRDVSAEHRSLYTRWARGRVALAPLLAALARHPRTRQRQRRFWISVSILALACVGGTAIWAERSWARRYTVQASGELDRGAGAARATDGQPATEWLLPDAQSGWIEVRFNRPRRLERVKVLNARNAPHNDRGTRAYQVLLFSGDKTVRAVDGEFSKLGAAPEWVEIPMPEGHVDRLRMIVKSFHKRGAGLAELRWE